MAGFNTKWITFLGHLV